jgi:pilus assembly protein CpaE
LLKPDQPVTIRRKAFVANIYVIDDDDQLLRMVGLMLERGGHTTTLISSPVKGLEKIKAEKPDLLVLDVMMPGMSGHDVCRQIRADQEMADLPILILTARAQEVDRDAALRSGANDYLSKPVTAQELIERVSDLLAQQPASAQTPTEGTIIGVLGMRGGIGQTTVAVNLAAALRRISQEEIVLVDLSPSGGQTTMHLRLQANRHWGMLPGSDSLDWETVKDSLLTHQSGLHLLAAPPLPQSPDAPSADTLKQLLQLLKENMAVVVIDLPPVFSPAAVEALQTADLLLHLVAPEVIAVQMAVQTNRFLAGSGLTIKQRSHILNQVTPEAQLPSAAVERGLSTRLAFQIGYDASQSRALAQGVPLTLTSAQSALPVAVQRMAEAIWQRVKQGQV